MRAFAVRIIGALNCAFGALGIYMFIYLIVLHWNNWPGSPGRLSWILFVILSASTVCLVGGLTFYGVYLIKGNELGLRPSRNILIAEIVYFILDIVLFWNRASMSHSALTVGFFGIAEGPLMP